MNVLECMNATNAVNTEGVFLTALAQPTSRTVVLFIIWTLKVLSKLRTQFQV